MLPVPLTAVPAVQAPRGAPAGSREEAAAAASRLSREPDGVLSGNVASVLSEREKVKCGLSRSTEGPTSPSSQRTEGGSPQNHHDPAVRLGTPSCSLRFYSPQAPQVWAANEPLQADKTNLREGKPVGERRTHSRGCG